MIGGSLMSGFVFTACENKGVQKNETGSHDNETSVIDTTQGVDRDSLKTSNTDTVYEPTSDTMYKRR